VNRGAAGRRAVHISAAVGTDASNQKKPGADRAEDRSAAPARSAAMPPYFLPRIASLAAFATRNFRTFLAGIRMLSPVAGLRPVRAQRLGVTFAGNG
jgi:hypothetical protein